HLPHAERHDVDAARVARVAARLWHGDAKRVAYVPKHRCDVRHLGPPDRARRRTRRSGWRPAVGPADEGRRCLCRSARKQCARSFGQGQFLVAVLSARPPPPPPGHQTPPRPPPPPFPPRPPTPP